MRETGELTFTTEHGGTRVIRVPDPAGSITDVVLGVAVNRIISANPFDETVGELKALVRAERIVVNRVAIIQ